MGHPAVSGQFDTSATVRRSTNHFKAEDDGATVIMSVEAGKFFTFDEIGFEIWDGVAAPRRIGELVDELAKKHNAPRERVEKDVMDFLNRLAAESLLDVE
jgi:hypothetical protein